jgi:hypothetical protein
MPRSNSAFAAVLLTAADSVLVAEAEVEVEAEGATAWP